MKAALILINILFESFNVAIVAILHTNNIKSAPPKPIIAQPRLKGWNVPLPIYVKNENIPAKNDAIKLISTVYATSTSTQISK